MRKKNIIIVALALILAGGLIWFGSPKRDNDARLNNTANEITEETTTEESIDITEGSETETTEVQDTAETVSIDEPMKNPIITLQTNTGNIEIELFLDTMPITAGNFLKLVNDGFYDGIKFHRVINNFMIQGGDPNTKGDNTATYGTGGPGYAIEDEFVEGISNVRGTLSMANSGPNTGGSQFFINLIDNTNLDFDKEPLSSKHPVFGKVVGGMDVVDAISKVSTGARDIPVEPVIIEKASVSE